MDRSPAPGPGADRWRGPGGGAVPRALPPPLSGSRCHAERVRRRSLAGCGGDRLQQLRRHPRRRTGAACVRRITMNRPEKRNSLDPHAARRDPRHAARHDQDPTSRSRSSAAPGPSFSAGYDLGGGNEGLEMPYYTPGGEGAWPRHVTEGWMSIWDLAKPVIAQVHGFCLAGGSELATGCDLVYMAEDAQMGYPAVRFGVPDMHFHAVVPRHAQGDGDDADRRLDHRRSKPSSAVGPTRAYPADELEERSCSRSRAHRDGADRAVAAQQARRAPPDGRDGPARRHPRRHRAVRARHAHQDDGAVRRARSARRASPNALQERDEPFGDYRTSA